MQKVYTLMVTALCALVMTSPLLKAQALINARPLKLFSSGTPINSITLQGPTTYSSVYTLTMPAAAPALHQLLISDGSGVLSWGLISNANISGSAAIDYSKLNLTNNISTADIMNAAITLPKISSSGATTGQVISYDGSNIVWANAGGGAPSGPAGGDLSGSYPNPTIAAGVIVDADVSLTAAISYSKLNVVNSIQNGDIIANAITTSKVANGTVTTPKLADSAVSGLKIVTSAVNTAHIADGAVTDAKVANGIAYSKLSGAPTSLPPSGAAGGDLTGTYPNPVIAANAVTSAKIADGTISNADVSATAAIAYSKLNLSGSVQGSDIASGTFTTTNAHHAIANNDNTARELRLLEPSGSGANYTAFKAQAQAATVTYTLPAADGTSGDVLSTNGSGTLSWTTPSGGGGGGSDPYGDGSAGALTISSATNWNSSPPSNLNLQFTDLTVNANLTVPSGTVIRCTGNFTLASGITITVLPAPGYANSGAMENQAYGGRNGNGQSGRFGGMGAASDLDALHALRNNKGGGSGGVSGYNGSELVYGSRGGGRLTIMCQGNISISGTVNANGEGTANPNPGASPNTGGSGVVGCGGGAGGVVVLAGKGTVSIGGAINANGGNGANGINYGGSGDAGGGGGGGGLVFVLAPAANSVTTSGVSVSGGSAGTTGTGSTQDNFGLGGGACGGNGGDGGTRSSVAGTTPPDYSISPSAGGTGRVVKVQVAKPENLIKY